MTILEVMISMLLLGLAVAGIYATFAVVGKGPQQSSGTDLRAINYARQELEILKNAVSTDSTRSADLTLGKHNLTVPSGFTEYYYDVADAPEGSGENYNYKRVTVTVKW
jgi:hypothetical protein